MPGSSLPFCIGSETWPGAAKLLEESGELAQVLGKLIAFPDGKHPDGKKDLAVRLENEYADLQAAMLFFIDNNEERLDIAYIANRVSEKLARFQRWHEEERNS